MYKCVRSITGVQKCALHADTLLVMTAPSLQFPMYTFDMGNAVDVLDSVALRVVLDAECSVGSGKSCLSRACKQGVTDASEMSIRE